MRQKQVAVEGQRRDGNSDPNMGYLMGAGAGLEMPEELHRLRLPEGGSITRTELNGEPEIPS